MTGTDGLSIGEREAGHRFTPNVSRDFDGNVVTNDNAVSVARFAVTSSVAVGDIQASTGTAITDNDGNGLPDSPAQVAAVYAQASSEGLRNDAGQVVFAPSRLCAGGRLSYPRISQGETTRPTAVPLVTFCKP